MKKSVLVLISVLFSIMASAQIDDDDIAFIQSSYGKTKRVIIHECLKLDSGQSENFWKLYDQYEIKRKEIVKERFELISQYAKKYDALDGKTASELMLKFISNSEKTNKLYKMYFKKFEKIIGGLNAGLMFQVETYLQTAFQANIQSQIPLVGELHKNASSLVKP